MAVSDARFKGMQNKHKRSRRRTKRRDPNRSPTYNLYVRISKDIGEAFQAFVDSSEPRASKKAHVETALKAYLRTAGKGADLSES
jgi:hypothetical protein